MNKLCLIFLCCISINAWGGNDLSSALGESKIIGHVKAMYVNDDRKGHRLDWNTPGFGGNIGFETGSFYGLQARAAWYTVTDLGMRDSDFNRVDGYIFDENRNPFSLLGEVGFLYKVGKTAFHFGRQEVNTPMMSSYDARIVPNLFEAYTVNNNDIDDTTLTFSYVRKMSGLDGLVSFSEFKSMSQQAYTSLSFTSEDYQEVNSNFPATYGFESSSVAGDKGVFVTGVKYDKNPTIQLWDYYCPDVINIFYGDISYKYDMGSNLQLTLGAQGYAVNDVGKYKDFLNTGNLKKTDGTSVKLNSKYQLYGIQSSLLNKTLGLTTTVAFNKFTGDENTVTFFGSWGAYPEYVSMPYVFPQKHDGTGSGQDLASPITKSKMGKIEFTENLGKLGLPGHFLLARYSKVDLDDSIILNSDMDLVDFLYRYQITKNLFAMVFYQNRDTPNFRYDNDTLTTSVRYDF
jgi:hypothetical protein